MTDRIDAVLPLLARDNPRFGLLRRSLERNMHALGTCWVVVPDAELAAQRALIESGRFRVLPESELLRGRRLYDHPGTRFGRGNTGWFVQQLIKLAMAERLETAFYLTLDADCICSRPAGYDDLVPGGRALTREHGEVLHRDWYDRASKLLGLPSPTATHGVTPALLHTQTTRDALAAVAARDRPGLRQLPPPFGGWQARLMRSVPWTEYTLYFTWAEATGAYDRFHTTTGYHCLFDNSVWKPELWDVWEPEPSFELSDDPVFFCLVQSTTEVAPDDVWARVRPWLGDGADEALPSPGGERAPVRDAHG